MLEAHVVKRRSLFTVDVRIRVPRGETLGLFGASGAGKSTALSCIAGLEVPDAGTIRFEDLALFPGSLPLHRRPVGYLTQTANLFPHRSVAQNVTFGAAVDARGPWVTELRERLRLEPLWSAPASALSGGQARRVALARMLAPRPRLVLLDEPFAGLDRHLVRELLQTLVAWQRHLGFTMIVVDHQADILERIASRAVVIEHGAAVQTGSWNDLRVKPATPLVAELVAPL